jgi:transposase
MGIMRQTVITALQKAVIVGIDWHTAESMSDRELSEKLFPSAVKASYKMPDYDYVHCEMSKPGMTQQLLWFEYSDKCRNAGEIPYGLTQFKKYYREYVAKTKATMHIPRKPGEILEVDWAGTTAHLTDADTGEVLDAYVFVAALPYSGYSYVEAFLDMTQESWIAAHVNAYTFFGGVTRILVPDNLKTGVVKNTKTELILNKAYQEMSEHYGTAIIPARVKAPKDKATVEGAVGNVTSFILASIRSEKFFSLFELNAEIREKLRIFNHRPFQKKDGSRATWFHEERQHLLALPKNSFELAEWKTAAVSFNYHIEVDKQFYSVPFDYIKRKVDVRITRNVVEVFCEGNRICSHVRIYGYKGQYSTVEAHMPPNHQQYLKWDGDRFRKWAAKYGRNTAAAIESILTRYKVEQQGYRACMAILKLADSYTPERLETACERALHYTPQPNYKNIQAILKSGQDIISMDAEILPETSGFGFTRGSDYYKGDEE